MHHRCGICIRFPLAWTKLGGQIVVHSAVPNLVRGGIRKQRPRGLTRSVAADGMGGPIGKELPERYLFYFLRAIREAIFWHVPDRPEMPGTA